MVRAVLDDRKFQTRRLLKLPKHVDAKHFMVDPTTRTPTIIHWPGDNAVSEKIKCPYGVPSDLLWVREPWRVGKPHNKTKPVDILPPLLKRGTGVTVMYEAGGWVSVGPPGREEPIYPDDIPTPEWAGRYRHARFMPRWASRLTLHINRIRIEQLHDISESDAIAEGVDRDHGAKWPGGDPGYMHNVRARNYARLWESLNGKGSWAANPWVWVIEFEPIFTNVDKVLEALAA